MLLKLWMICKYIQFSRKRQAVFVNIFLKILLPNHPQFSISLHDLAQAIDILDWLINYNVPLSFCYQLLHKLWSTNRSTHSPTLCLILTRFARNTCCTSHAKLARGELRISDDVLSSKVLAARLSCEVVYIDYIATAVAQHISRRRTLIIRTQSRPFISLTHSVQCWLSIIIN